MVTEKELKQMRNARKRINVFKKPAVMWGTLIVLALFFSVLISYTYSGMPSCSYRTFMEEHYWVYIVLMCVLGVGYFPGYIGIIDLVDRRDKKLCLRISRENHTADEMMKLAEEYMLEHMFFHALDRRMEELSITEVPECCKDGYIPYRLPTIDDI